VREKKRKKEADEFKRPCIEDRRIEEEKIK
jgi:hypothetical protein